jgi:hypothetical protein
MPAMTRGPLPPSVYWRRRLIVITVVLVIVAVALEVFGHGGGTTPRATPTANLTHPPSSPAASSPDPTAGSTTGSTPTDTATPSPTPSPTPTAPPTPSGPCAASDVLVVPSVTTAAAGTPVPIVLTLQTAKAPACTWRVSRKTVQVKVTSASGAAVWSTVQCPKAVPASEVVVYRDTPTTVQVDWSARRADDVCSTHTAWSRPGDYQVTAVALGGEPARAAFTLGQPGSVSPAAPSTSPTATPSAPTSGATAPSGTAGTPGASASAQPTKHAKKHQIVD